MTSLPQAKRTFRAYQLKIVLVDSEPEIWRRVQVPSGLTLVDVHTIIQLAMGWENVHDYAFERGLGTDRTRYETSVSLAEALADEGPLYYTYDFESGWLHRITVEAIEAVVAGADNLKAELAADNLEADNLKATVLPTCSAGAQACPPEGTGGVWGYDDFLDRLDDQNDPDYLTLIEKYGTFDPDVFDVKAAAARVEALASTTTPAP